MKRTVAYVLSACVLLTAGGTAMQRGLTQDSTQYPGQPTRANVWIQNRGDMEAVPVSIENVSTESALRVELAGTGIHVSLVYPIGTATHINPRRRSR